MKQTLTVAATALTLLASASCQKEQPLTPEENNRYENAKVVTLSTLDRYQIKDTVCVKNATVLASTTLAKLIWDGTGLGATTAEIPVGQKATVKGIIEGSLSYVDYHRIGDCEVSELAPGDFYPSDPEDITSKIDSYFPDHEDAPELVCFTGGAGAQDKDGLVRLYAGDTQIIVLHPTANLGFSSLDGRTVKVTGYAFYNTGYGLLFVATKAEPQDGKTLTALWSFNKTNMKSYGPLWTGGASANSDGQYIAEPDKTAGAGNGYINSHTANAKITYVQVDKTSLECADGTPAHRVTAGGNPNCTGCLKGDYWLFTIRLDKEFEAGATVSIAPIEFTGNKSCLKYWMIEILDGDWTPIDNQEKKDGTVYVRTETVTSFKEEVTKEVTYNIAKTGGSDNIQGIVTDYKLTHATNGVLQIRIRAVENFTANPKPKDVDNYQATPSTGFFRLENAIISISPAE